jgi:hypothetical protein
MMYRLLTVLVFFLLFITVQLPAAGDNRIVPVFTEPFITEVNATDCNSFVLLQWKVSNNTLADHYEIQRMDANGTYHTIAILLSDNLKETEQYMYKDKITVRDLQFQYRIKVMLTGGEEQYSSSLMIEPKSVQNKLTKVVYRQSDNTINMYLPGAEAEYVYRFYNIMGKMTKVTSAKTQTIIISDLKRGSYFIEAFQPQTGKRYYGEFRKE